MSTASYTFWSFVFLAGPNTITCCSRPSFFTIISRPIKSGCISSYMLKFCKHTINQKIRIGNHLAPTFDHKLTLNKHINVRRFWPNNRFKTVLLFLFILHVDPCFSLDFSFKSSSFSLASASNARISSMVKGK